MKAGYLRAAAFNMGTGPAFGLEVSKENMQDFEKNLAYILDKITNDRHFKAMPSENEEAGTCINKSRNKSCEFAAFCDYALEKEEEKTNDEQ